MQININIKCKYSRRNIASQMTNIAKKNFLIDILVQI